MNEDKEITLQNLLEEYDLGITKPITERGKPMPDQSHLYIDCSADVSEQSQSIAIDSETGDNSQTQGNKVNETSTNEGEKTMYEPQTTETYSPNERMEQSTPPTPAPDFTEPVEAVAPSLMTSALIVNLSRSVPDLVKNDPEAAKALAKIMKADKRAVRTTKSLIDSAALKALRSFSREIYQWHIRNTVPWGDLGQRLIPNSRLIDYQNDMNKFEQTFNALAENVLLEYPACCGRAQAFLGEMFDAALFPSLEELRSKMGIRVSYEPIADPDNFIVKVGNQAADELKKQYNDVLSNRMGSISNHIFERLREPLANLVLRLDYAEGERPSGFRNTLVDNVTEIVNLMDTCNFNNDPKLDAIKRGLRSALKGVTPDGLREDAGLRSTTKQGVQKIIDQLPSLGFDVDFHQ